MRRSVDQYDSEGRLFTGYDYTNQAWVKDGVYVRCSHPESTVCSCYGRAHAGEQTLIGNLAAGAGDYAQFLLKEWLLFSEGLLDPDETKRLYKWTQKEVVTHA